MTLPGWLIPLPDAAAMRASDRFAIETRGIPGLDLMERAGTAVAHAVERVAPDGTLTVVCGKGNNGGDGLVAARVLRDSGREVEVVLISSELSPDARVNLERVHGAPPLALEDERAARAIAGSAALVDALLGTGFSGEPRGATAEAIAALNAAQAPVVAVDVPSGVDASNGVVSGAAVRAAVTVTFHTAKPGLWIAPGKAHAGEVEVIDIGIPRDAPVEVDTGLIRPAILDLLPRRAPDSTKFSSGHVLVAGGSRGLTGAPMMSAHASMRAGAGYVTACVPESLQPIVATKGPAELMTRGLPDEDGALSPAGVETVLEAGARAGALVLGPGIGSAEGAREFARELARRTQLPLVVDADGLNAHAGAEGALEQLAERAAETVLTPHAGELGRLLGREREEVERERLRHVREAAALTRAVVVLKGDDSLIAHPDGRVAVSPGASPGLATAGTGDVLSGVIGALLAQGLEAFLAAAAGVWLHVLAGREAARREGAAESVVASDVIEALGAARSGTRERAWRPGGRLADPTGDATGAPQARWDVRGGASAEGTRL